jgi:triosephosphate isomerase
MTIPLRRPLVAGNWKMNGLGPSVAELKRIIGASAALTEAVDLLICPPATLLMAFAKVAEGTPVAVGGQDCHSEPAGAFTGDISAEMLKDAGATAVIVGHSERRTLHRETDSDVSGKALAAWRAGLTAIVCIGETRAEREAGDTLAVLGRQLDGSLPGGPDPSRLVVAYEPVWAIGTGLTPTAEDVGDAHTFIRQRIAERHGTAAKEVRILYGGSVKPSNARDLLKVTNVDGALVGGASLKADDFLAIAGAYS